MELLSAFDLQSTVNAVKTAEEYDNIYASVGYHPHDVKYLNDEILEKIKELSKRKKVVAIGEIGLDYYYDNSPRDVQRKWFVQQLKLAEETDLPFIVHSREATEDTYNILMEHKKPHMKGVLHCYSGSFETAQKYVEMGLYISIAGPVTFRNSKKTKRVAELIPLEWLLIETDCPYLTPEPYRGKRNEPSYVRYVAQEIAKLRGIDFDEVAQKTAENFKKLFGIK